MNRQASPPRRPRSGTSLRPAMRRPLRALVLLSSLLLPVAARAGYTETLPAGTFLLDERLAFSRTLHHWHDDGRLGPLLDPIERYEPGGGLQGTLIPDVVATYTLLINLLLYGVTDDLTVGLGLPLVLENTVVPRLGWIPGDDSTTLGRPYSEEDFWAWAESMGQPRPTTWSGNRGQTGDTVLALRWRFSDRLLPLRAWGLSAALYLFGSLPTGRQPDPEEVLAAGTTSWNLHAQGEFGAHLAVERRFGPLTLGVDLFHEIFLPRTWVSATGTKHPLLLRQRPYVGETYVIDPGDFTGAEVGVDWVLWEGPLFDTWLSRRTGPELPPLITVSVRYNFTGIGQSDWQSASALWDYQQERFWRPGYKNILYFSATASLLRLGLPAQIYATYRNLTWLPSRNTRAPNVFFFGIQIPLKFW